ncbi:EAL domain-containing response regulator [Thermomonas sp. HDW16]|uniref:EAL domain-containing protein n=1 Tax=Thermomonas sp. HDW16 TaxID=2714945 RepID=UPI00140BCC29|nr:EAL domain-containing response regulator [Thermomonas sp. HDW16]QIL19789.1 EAL domain-containing protein [Thermomonas sp. HDW16]
MSISLSETPYRILVVEDDRSQALFAEAILRGAGMQAEVVAVPEQVMAAVEHFEPDLVLMDLHMPGTSGTALTLQIREHPRFSQLPVVFLTGDQDPERQMEVLEHGADDFILKPVRPRHLIAAVKSRVHRARLAQSRQAVTTEPERHPITGLFTRPALMKKLAELLPQRTGGVLMLEAGNAIALRNRFGYAEFEQLMSDAGRFLGDLAQSHAAARLSDNAFLVIASDPGGIPLDALARNLRDGMGYHDFQVGDETIRLRTTVGYADLTHGFSDAGATLASAEEGARLARTDAAGIGAYVPPSASAADAADGLLDEIRIALENDGLQLAFQPVVAVAGGEEAQFQVLLRMRDSTGNEHSAGEILPLADSANLVPQLDRWVIQQALSLLQKRRAESRPIRLFVSQSPRTLAQDDYASWLAQELEAASIDGPSLVIDMRLEDALVHSMLLRQFCEELVPVGVQFCLSQYRHNGDAEQLLQQLPLGYLRLSAEYARQPLPPNLRDEMREAIDRAHRLGLQVIGQAVEDPQAAAALWMGGIDFIQGNLVQRVEHELNFDFQHATL